MNSACKVKKKNSKHRERYVQNIKYLSNVYVFFRRCGGGVL